MKTVYLYLAMALCLLLSCSSHDDDNAAASSPTCARVTFTLGGEFSTHYESIRAATQDCVYEVFIDEKTGETSLQPVIKGTFSSLSAATTELPIGKTYLVSIAASDATASGITPTEKFASVKDDPAITYTAGTYTHYSSTTRLPYDRYYGESTATISATTNNIAVNASYCDFALRFNVTKPAKGEVTISCTNPAFFYTMESDGTTTFPSTNTCYTMLTPWAGQEDITLHITHSADNYSADRTITVLRNKALVIAVNVNPTTNAAAINCVLEEKTLTETDLSIDRDETSSTPTPPASSTGSYEYVDLGLSVKWATCNIGASTPEDLGTTYAWGETTTTVVNNTNSKTTSTLKSSGIIDEDCNLTADYDVASALWGGTWRMPTKAEWEELRDGCTWTTDGSNNLVGTSNTNSNTIVIPRGASNCYWTATAENTSSSKESYLFAASDKSVGKYARNTPGYIRPVTP